MKHKITSGHKKTHATNSTTQNNVNGQKLITKSFLVEFTAKTIPPNSAHIHQIKNPMPK